MLKGKQSKKRRNYFRIDSSFYFTWVHHKNREFAFDTTHYFLKHPLIKAATNEMLHPILRHKFLGYFKSASAFVIVYDDEGKIRKKVVGWFEHAEDVDLPEV